MCDGMEIGWRAEWSSPPVIENMIVGGLCMAVFVSPAYHTDQHTCMQSIPCMPTIPCMTCIPRGHSVCTSNERWSLREAYSLAHSITYHKASCSTCSPLHVQPHMLHVPPTPSTLPRTRPRLLRGALLLVRLKGEMVQTPQF